MGNDPPPSVLVANKADVDSVQWVVGTDEVQKMKANWRNCMEVFYTSAKSSRDIANAFDGLCMAVREWRHRRRLNRDALQEMAASSQDGFFDRRCRLTNCVNACVLL